MFPEGPVVPAQRSPIVEMMSDSFARQDIREAVSRAAVFPRSVAGGDMDVAMTELRHYVSVGKVREVIHWIVEVGVVVVHSVHEILYVVNAGKWEAPANDVGVLEQGVCGVLSAERRSNGRNSYVM